MCRLGIGRYISEIANRKTVHSAMSVPMRFVHLQKLVGFFSLSRILFTFASRYDGLLGRGTTTYLSGKI